jgi:CO dehydrogenase/acetyl-CoA synthase delta subunit
MRYRVDPGLYSLGSPTAEAQVFVTANYKLSFDHLRKDLGEMNAWILVLDTKGINVWCAAGKGTFSTNELVRRVGSEKLAEKVSHKNLIVPQLGAPGIAAHEVKKKTGFTITYGPIRSRDVQAFIANSNAVTPAMRTVTFTLAERAVLIPMDAVNIIKKLLLPLVIIAIVMGIKPQGILFKPLWEHTLPLLAALGVAIFSGAVLHPVLLPLFPLRSFALQGLSLGLLAGAFWFFSGFFSVASIYAILAIQILIAGLSSYIAFNFTGATPIANKSGVKKELRIAIPLYIVAVISVIVLLIAYKLSLEGLL